MHLFVSIASFNKCFLFITDAPHLVDIDFSCLYANVHFLGEEDFTFQSVCRTLFNISACYGEPMWNDIFRAVNLGMATIGKVLVTQFSKVDRSRMCTYDGHFV